MRAVLTAVAALLAAAASACGDPTTSTPSPEAIATAESVARSVSIEAPASSTPEAGGEGAPIVLDGRVFGDGSTGVILAHMRPSDQTSWFPFATTLARAGDFTVLTFDFRGYGESTGEKEFDRIDADLQAAYEYMRDVLGKDRIYIVGASMGGTAALVVAERVQTQGVATISAQDRFHAGTVVLDAVEPTSRIDAPKLFITSEDDVPSARSQEELWAVATEPRDQHIYEGDAHGTDLFDSPHAADLERRLIEFVSNGG